MDDFELRAGLDFWNTTGFWLPRADGLFKM